MDKQIPTIGYFKFKGLYGSLARQAKVTQACRFVSNDFSVVTEFSYKFSLNNGIEVPYRFVWHKVIRLLKKGLVKTLVLSELSDSESKAGSFADFVLFLQTRQIRLISIREGFDSDRQGYFHALELHKSKRNERKINGFAA